MPARRIDGSNNCNQCDYRCSSGPSLVAHMAKYHNGRAFRCSYPGCSEQIMDENNLRRHVRTVHKTSKIHFWCSTCRKDFGSRSDNARRHERTSKKNCSITKVGRHLLDELKQDTGKGAVVAFPASSSESGVPTAATVDAPAVHHVQEQEEEQQPKLRWEIAAEAAAQVAMTASQDDMEAELLQQRQQWQQQQQQQEEEKWANELYAVQQYNQGFGFAQDGHFQAPVMPENQNFGAFRPRPEPQNPYMGAQGLTMFPSEVAPAPAPAYAPASCVSTFAGTPFMGSFDPSMVDPALESGVLPDSLGPNLDFNASVDNTVAGFGDDEGEQELAEARLMEDFTRFIDSRAYTHPGDAGC